MDVSTVDEFKSWLNAKLREFNTDESVFGSYLMGILEGDESIEEKTEGLEGILAEIIESDSSAFLKEIVDKWKQCTQAEEQASAPKAKLDVDQQLAKMLETQKLAKKEEREYTEEERRIKEQILSQYSQLSESEHEGDDDGDGAGGGGAGASTSSAGLSRNTNAADVAALVREKREQARLESQQKKDKDKQDREKQKQLREEKKEKRKTVKGERRR